MACSHTTCISALLLIWASAAVNSIALPESLSHHEGALTIPAATFWQHPQHKRELQQVCGARLITTLRFVCQGRYAGPSRRSDPNFRAGALDEIDYRDPTSGDSGSYHELDNAASDFDLLWPSNPKLFALKLVTEGGIHQRYRRNVIEECCKNPCRVSDMTKYCGGRQ